MPQGNQNVTYRRDANLTERRMGGPEKRGNAGSYRGFVACVVLVLAGIFFFTTADAARSVRSGRDRQPPTVSITSPSAGSTINGVVSVAVGATDNVGVVKVNLLVNGATVASTTAAPYAFSWDSTKVPNGSVTLAAVAYDQAGNSASASETVTVSNNTQPPSVGISSPSPGSTLKGMVVVSVSATDNVGVAKVNLLVNGTLVASTTTTPYSFNWDSTKTPNGSVTLAAAAYDTAGNSASASETVTVSNDSQAPSVAIGSPAPGSTVKGTVAVSVSANDNVAIARVDLKANGALVGSTTTAPYTFNWDTTKVADGSVILSASAYDAAGNSATASSNETVANTTSDPTLTVSSSNPTTGVSVRVYPADLSGLGDGTATLTRNYNTNSRVWLSAALRSGSNYFTKWQKDGVDYDTASTTSVVMDANHTVTAVYETPSCVGVAVYPGTDSIKNAVATYPAGSTFCIKAGTHRLTTSVIARTGDKYIGEPGAILNGSKILTSFIRVGSYWVATGQTQQEPPAVSTNGGWPVCLSTAPACIYREKVFVNGQDLWQVTSLAELVTGTFYFDYANYAIYLFDDPTGKTVETTTGSGGIIGYSGGANDSVTIKNLVFEKFGGGLVTGSAHNALKTANNWIVQNSEFRLISYIAVMNNNSLVRNNYIHHNGQYGITGNGTFEGNVISYNNTDGWNTGNDAGASKFHGVNGLVARGNIVSNNQSRGLWTDTDNINTTYENNIIENNVQMGILHEKSCAATIKNNVLRGNNSTRPGTAIWSGAQIFTTASKDSQIFGNDVTAAAPGVNGIGIYNWFVNGVQMTYTGANCGIIETRNVAVHDNVVRLDVGQQNGIAGGGAGYAASYNILFSNNTYYLKDLAGAYFQVDGGTIKTKELWQAAGQDVTGKFYQY